MEICDFLKSWKRMCNSMTEMNGCEDCPIVKNTHGARCGDMPCEMQDVESIAREVEKWAAENPEPVYPSYIEVFGWAHKKTWAEIKDILANPIPADIAEKLGLQPKEG